MITPLRPVGMVRIMETIKTIKRKTKKMFCYDALHMSGRPIRVSPYTSLGNPIRVSPYIYWETA